MMNSLNFFKKEILAYVISNKITEHFFLLSDLNV